MAVTKKTVGAVLQSGLPATTYVEDFETRRVLDSIKTALRLLGNILDGNADDVATDIAPDVQIEAGQGIKVQNRGGNRFKISSDGSDIGASNGDARSSIQTGAETLTELTDVALSGLAAGDALKYSYALKWINEANRTPFSFIQTGLKAGYFVEGKLRLNGTEITPSAITFGTGGIATVTATHHYMRVTISTGATAWATGTSFPADTDTIATIPVAIFTFTGGGDILTYTPVLSDHFVQYGTVPNGTATDQILTWNETSHQWVVGSATPINPRSFAFLKTSTTGGTLYHGSVYLAGVAKTMSAWTDHGTGADLTISGVTTTTRYYVAVELASATATWNSTTSAFPASDDDTEVFPILTLTCADSVITAVKEHWTCDIHVPSNV